MLYISTRNKVDSFTAHRVFHEAFPNDGGLYVPFRLSAFNEEYQNIRAGQSVGKAIASILNHFFGFTLSGWDIDCVIGRAPFELCIMNRRITVAQCYHNPESSWEYIVKNLYACMGGSETADAPQGWVRIAIEIAILFGIYTQMDSTEDAGFDICVTGGDLATVSAALYAKDLGLPIEKILCVCNENGSLWEFIRRGELNTGIPVINTGLPELDTVRPKYLEYLIHRGLGVDAVKQYTTACEQNGIFRLDEDARMMLEREVTATVASTNRVDAVISSMYRTHQYIADPALALSYGGLQDYRASTGISNHTLLLAKESPVLSAERITKTLNISQDDLMKQINSPKE